MKLSISVDDVRNDLVSAFWKANPFRDVMRGIEVGREDVAALDDVVDFESDERISFSLIQESFVLLS